MIQIEEAIIRKLTIHRITNELNSSVISDDLFDTSNEDEEDLFKKILLKPFINHSQTFEFGHDVSLDYNVLFNVSRTIYEGGEFIEQSKSIAKHLISTSSHHNIKEGDLFIAMFDEIKLNNSYYEGIGIYKFEDKDSFIETSIHNKKLGVSFKKGIGNKKPDKACLILFTNEPYTILIIDNSNIETEYWQNDFIGQKTKNDNVNSTNNFLTLTKNFVTKQLDEEFEVTKADKIDLLNRSVEYFKTHETFDKKEFEEEVFQDSGIIKSFRNFDNTYRQENEIEITDSFDISPQAVKKQARVFKSVLKLDKNFHIYIHGNRDMIEQGVDKDGRKYYKIYYDQES